jgi:ParB-like nuclease domain
MLKRTAEHIDMPDLCLMPVEALVLHEHADAKRVARMQARLSADGFLKNPPIVAPIPGTDRFVVLDGANRTRALEALGCKHILAQVVDYKSGRVQLLTWHHLITGKRSINFLKEITGVQGLVLRPLHLKLARAALADRAILAYIAVPIADGPERSAVFTVDGTDGNEHLSAEKSTFLLNALVDTYKGDPQVSIHRTNSDDLDDFISYYDDIGGIVVFPPYTPDDILRLAQAGTKVPTGITRHIISHRALRVNVPVSLMSGSQSLEEKNAWWQDQIRRKLAANEVRFYQESTYLFDE